MPQQSDYPHVTVQAARSVAGVALLGYSWVCTFAQSLDFQVISSTLNVTIAGVIGAWFLLEQTRLKVRKNQDRQDREAKDASFQLVQKQKHQTIALELREKRLRERTAIRMMLEHDRAMKGSLTCKVEELTSQLEHTEAQVREAQETAAAERAELMERVRVAEERLADILAKSHESLAARLDRGNAKLDSIGKRIDGQRRVLVVEDDLDTCRAMVTLLRDRGFEAECASSLAEARRKFTGRCYWIWVDLKLPDGSGLDFVREVKARGVAAKVGVMTGSDDERIDTAADMAMVDLLRRKPVDVDALVEDMRAMDDSAARVRPAPMQKGR